MIESSLSLDVPSLNPAAPRAPNVARLHVDEQCTPSLVQRIGVGGVVRLSVGATVCLANVAFYTMLPLAGLAFLPFLFFGCVCLMTGIADEVGYYR